MKLRELRGVIVDTVVLTRDLEKLYDGMMYRVPEELLDCTVDWINSEFETVDGKIRIYTGVRVK